MKALTVSQPWASLIMTGAKPYEFRRWCAPARLIQERIVIHAGAQKPTLADLEEMYWQVEDGSAGLEPVEATRFVMSMSDGIGHAPMLRLPRGAGLGTALLGRPVLCTELWPNDSGIRTDMWAWPLTEIEPFARPIPALGARQFWDWPEAGETP